MTHHNDETKMTIADKVAGYIGNNKILLWSLLAILIILVVVFAVVDSKIKETYIMYANTAVEVQEDYQNWFNASDDDKAAFETVFLDKISIITEAEKSNILVEKSLFLRGQFYIQNEDWENAFADFNQIAVNSPDSYLASVSLYNAASAKENSGDLKAALDILVSISKEYRLISPIIPEALFNEGRLNEALNLDIEALKAYEDLVSSYSSSNWTNLAKTRIISLKASGVSQ